MEGDVFKTIIPLIEQATEQVEQATEQVEQVSDQADQASAQASAQASDQVTDQADEDIKRLLEFCKTPRSREEMQRFLNLNHRGYFRRTIINPLVKGGLLKLTIPDKPTSPNQKYYSESL